MIVLDSSIMVGIIKGEDGADRLLGILSAEDCTIGAPTLVDAVRIVVDFTRERRRAHSSGNPALRSASNAGCRNGSFPTSHLTLSLGLRRRASARGAFA